MRTKPSILAGVLLCISSVVSAADATPLNEIAGRDLFTSHVDESTVEVHKTLILRPNDRQLVRALAGYTIKPAEDWLESSHPLIKLTTVSWEAPEHQGLRPSFALRDVTLDCDFRCQGLYLDRVLGSYFQGLVITRAAGRALMMSRTKETDFYSLTVTNCLEVDDEPLIDFGYPVLSRGMVDGCNHLRFFGGRINFANHRCYIGMHTQPNTAAIRMITFTGLQVHVPTAADGGFRGQPTEDFCEPRERLMIQTSLKLSRIHFERCSFTTRGSPTHVDHPRMTFSRCHGVLAAVPEVAESTEPFWPKCGVCGQPIATRAEAEEFWLGSITRKDPGKIGYIHKGGNCPNE